MSERVAPVIVVDGTNSILGRLASFAAKKALQGFDVQVVNCNDVLVSGKRANIIAEYRVARQRGGNSLRGPNFPKHPERVVKRTIRGMLRYSHGRGKAAFHKIKCYNECPEAFASKKQPLEHKKLSVETMKLSELGRLL